ncbi:hypothetical protein V6N13_073911 [Hibiscus sabdariffa]
MHNKVPAKKTDAGSFTIQCSIGHNYSTKALCDPGASINLMPKSVIQKLDIGEAKPTTMMLQLADHSFVQPKGKIEDILVRVNKFIFPTDFLILDCEADEHAPIILGRPFLATSRAIIDFDKDEKAFRVDKEQVKMKVFIIPEQLEYKEDDKAIHNPQDKCTQRLKPYMGAHTERDKTVILENYELDPIIYKRLNNLSWLHFGRQLARANLNWVMEFYANNDDGDDIVTVRGRKVSANSATVNNILDLSNDSPIIFELINILEDEDLDTIKDQLCEQGTEWNVKGKNPKTISRPHLQPEAKL